MNHLFIVMCSLPLLGCATVPAPATQPVVPPTLILILVGGNSEAIHDEGLWKLYKGSLKDTDVGLLRSLERKTGLTEPKVATYYFSWTGDNEAQRNSWFPSHGSWITGGSAWIEQSLREVLGKYPSAQVAVVGWSNGGATAYELACTLSAKRSPDILITLDPVSWTTRPCAHYSAGRVSTPSNWITVYTSSGLWCRLNVGNIIALIGRAWDADRLPSQLPKEYSYHAEGTNHGQTEVMWRMILEDKTFNQWAASFRSK